MLPILRISDIWKCIPISPQVDLEKCRIQTLKFLDNMLEPIYYPRSVKFRPSYLVPDQSCLNHVLDQSYFIPILYKRVYFVYTRAWIYFSAFILLGLIIEFGFTISLLLWGIQQILTSQILGPTLLNDTSNFSSKVCWFFP